MSRRRTRLLPVALVTLAGGVLAGCSPGYVLRAGWEEAQLLSRRRPIHDVVHDTASTATVRAKLRLVQDARDFAERSLGLRAGSSFESYVELRRDTLALNVSAAPEFALRWKTWWFPIVGRVPYKGYFDFEQAREEARRLKEAGWDVSLRPVAAFSTLGWLPDPIISTTLRMDSVSLVETVIHEITHSTYYASGQARFNESLANFVGHRGAIAFFCDALREPGACREARARWHDSRVFGAFFESLVAPLRGLYASDLPAEAKRGAKREIFHEAAERFREEVRPRLRAGSYGELDPDRLDNAWVLARLLYYTRLDDFEAVHRREGSVRAAFRALVDAAGETGDPWRALDRLAPEAEGTIPGTEGTIPEAEGRPREEPAPAAPAPARATRRGSG